MFKPMAGPAADRMRVVHPVRKTCRPRQAYGVLRSTGTGRAGRCSRAGAPASGSDGINGSDGSSSGAGALPAAGAADGGDCGEKFLLRNNSVYYLRDN